MLKANIFIVEDELIVSMEIQQRLNILGYDIAGTASSGEEAIEKITAIKPDLVLMDIMLKGKLDGIQVAEIILNEVDVPIIFLTAFSEENTIQRAKSIQPYGYIIKPFDERELYTNIEITLHKHASKKELNEKQQWLSTILKSIGDAVIATDKNGIINFMNGVAEELTGYKSEETVGKPLHEIFKILDDSTHKLIESPVAKVIESGKIIDFTNHSLLVSKDGDEKPIQSSAAPILDDWGIIQGVVLVFQDISERKHIEQKLKLQSSALNAAYNGVIITTKDGAIVWCNSAITRLTGYEAEELIGSNPRLLKSDKHDEMFYKNIWKTISAGKVWEGELVNKKKDGTLYFEEMTITPVKNEIDEITHFIAIKHDISDRKKFEEDLIEAKDFAERSNRLKSEFLTQLSHEIRTPVNSILSFSNLLRSELKDRIEEDLKFSFDMIDRGGRRLIRTIDLILDMSAVHTGAYVPSFEKLKLSTDIIEPILKELLIHIKSKGLKLTFDNRLDNIQRIYADKYSTTQIFSNLLDNAIKYTEQGEIKVSTMVNADGYICAAISDTGIGISEEYMKDLFEPFRQEEQGYSRKFEGNGLGLALVKSYCQINHAQISVESKKNLGTTFTLYFPTS
ncbi:MAG: PAS domain S-box protein [bacterium]